MSRKLAGVLIFTGALILIAVGSVVNGRNKNQSDIPTLTANSTIFTPTIPPTPANNIVVTPIVPKATETLRAFDGRKALEDVVYQVDTIGDRSVGTPGHDQIVQWISDQLKEAGWDVQIQTATSMGHPIQNIIASRSSYENASPWIILGAHYDNRMYADRDPDPANRTKPVPGANDGASGVAVLLELARTLPKNLNERLWLVFWDAEDNGSIPGWDWILGSKVFVAKLPTAKPDMMVNLDMIGDASLDIKQETNSTPSLVKEIWTVAADLGYSQYFLPQRGFNMEDDHTSFLQAGIPAVDIIDFNYPYWHTISDTPDKVSAQSMMVVGTVLTQWLKEKQP